MLGLVWFLLVHSGFCLPVAAESTTNQAAASNFQALARERAETAYQDARKAVTSTNSVKHLWQLGRTAFDFAEVNSREKIKAQIAETGIDACRAAIRKDPTSAAAHYYQALCLGQLAQTKTLGALRLVREMQVEFERARVLDESFDYAGPDRGLGLLYLEAPGWPTSIGDRKQARSHLAKAVALAPIYPDNRIAYLELLVRTKDPKTAVSELAEVNAIWTKVKLQLSGPEWIGAWMDWEARKKRLEAKISTTLRK